MGVGDSGPNVVKSTYAQIKAGMTSQLHCRGVDVQTHTAPEPLFLLLMIGAAWADEAGCGGALGQMKSAAYR